MSFVYSFSLLASLVCRTINVAYNLSPQTRISNMGGNCLGGVEPKTKVCLHVGVYAVLWALLKLFKLLYV